MSAECVVGAPAVTLGLVVVVGHAVDESATEAKRGRDGRVAIDVVGVEDGERQRGDLAVVVGIDVVAEIEAVDGQSGGVLAVEDGEVVVRGHLCVHSHSKPTDSFSMEIGM